MEDEEKKAIDELKVLIGLEEFNKLSYKENKSIEIVLNLIEKQQKEIEELKKYKDGYKLLNYSLNNFVSKDKIKAKIEDLEKETKNTFIRGEKILVLQSLLEKEDNNG